MNIYGAVHTEAGVEFLRANRMGIEVYSNPDGFDNPEYHKTIAKRIKGMSGVSMHGTIYDMAYASKDPLIIEVVKKRFTQSVRDASEHGINRLIFHSSYRTFYGEKGSHLEKWYIKASIDFWKDFLGSIPDGMTVLLENVEDNAPEVLARIIDGIGSPKVYCCFDAAHAYAYSSVPLDEWVRVLGHRIKLVHLSDNDGKTDLHLPLGEGSLPLLSTIQNIFEYVGKEVPFVLECALTSSVDWLKGHNLLTGDGENVRY